MDNIFLYTIVCTPKKSLTTESNDSANAISRSISGMLKALNVIYSPYVNFSFRHAGNDRAYHYTHRIGVELMPRASQDYSLIFTVLFAAIQRVTSAVASGETGSSTLLAQELDTLDQLAGRPLTEQETNILTDYVGKMERGLLRQKEATMVKVFRAETGTRSKQPSVIDPQPTLIDPPQPGIKIPPPAGIEVPDIVKVHDKIVEQLDVNFSISYSGRYDRLVVNTTINGGKYSLSYSSPEILQKVCDALNSGKLTLKLAIDINPDDNGYLCVEDIIADVRNCDEELS